MTFRYTVRVSLADAAMATEWLDWMKQTHLAEVLAAGAQSAEIVKLDSPANTFEARYCFETRTAFEQYERLHAPRLRAAGLAKFGPERGVKYERSTGEVV